MKNPIITVKRDYFPGTGKRRTGYVATLGSHERNGMTAEAAQNNLIADLCVRADARVAVRLLNDGRIAVLTCTGCEPNGGFSYLLQRHNADGTHSSASMFGAPHWNAAYEQFLADLKSCGQI